MRKLLVLLCVLAFVVPAWSYDIVWDFPSGGGLSEDITISLQIDCWNQIDWQDLVIAFDGVTDWWEDVLMNEAYDPCPDDAGKFAADPWAGDSYYAGTTGRYYESGDGAVVFCRSNNGLKMDVHVNGNLTGTINPPYGEIPTWFTLAFAPFQIAGVWQAQGQIPGDGWGFYAGDAGSGNFALMNAAYNWPNQHAFACAPASQTWTTGMMAPPVQGTIKFLARILRHGMADKGDLYTTWIDVTWSTTPAP